MADEQLAPRKRNHRDPQVTDLNYFSNETPAREDLTPSLLERPAPSSRKSKKRKRPSKKKTGGWPVTKYLHWWEVKTIKDSVHRLTGAGFKPDTFLTLRPPPEIVEDAERKLWCRRKLGNIQRLFRRGDQKFCAVSVFEKPLGGQIHMHTILFCPSGLKAKLNNMHSHPEIDVRPARERHTAYVLKNRRPLSPDFEANIKHQISWKKAAPFRGKRWVISPDAQQILAGA